MSRQHLYVGLAGIAIAIAAGVLLFGPAQRQHVAPASPQAARNEPAAAAVANEDPASAGHEQDAAAENVPTRMAETVATRDPPVAQANDRTFRVNASGRLVLDQATRLNMEVLFARAERNYLAEAKQQAVAPLPAAAAAQAAELLEHYDNYQQAQKQAYPPGLAPSTEEAALAELDGLHSLRIAHFGPVVARALYGEEEAVSRQLVEQMRQERDQSLTMEERAERAQRLRDSTR